jgi:hypothetical protein
MATRSRIAIKHQDGTIDSIYCHWDGYPSGVGQMLVEHYSRKEAEQLMEVGDIRTLADTPDRCEDYKDAGRSYPNLESFLQNLGKRHEEYGYVLMEDDRWYYISVHEDNNQQFQLVSEALK